MTTYRKSERAIGQKADRVLPAAFIEPGHFRLSLDKEPSAIE